MPVEQARPFQNESIASFQDADLDGKTTPE